MWLAHFPSCLMRICILSYNEGKRLWLTYPVCTVVVVPCLTGAHMVLLDQKASEETEGISSASEAGRLWHWQLCPWNSKRLSVGTLQDAFCFCTDLVSTFLLCTLSAGSVTFSPGDFCNWDGKVNHLRNREKGNWCGNPLGWFGKSQKWLGKTGNLYRGEWVTFQVGECSLKYRIGSWGELSW